MQLATVKEAAPRLGFDEPSLYRIIRENQFPVPQAILRFGKQIRINLEFVEETMRQNTESIDTVKK